MCFYVLHTRTRAHPAVDQLGKGEISQSGVYGGPSLEPHIHTTKRAVLRTQSQCEAAQTCGRGKVHQITDWDLLHVLRDEESGRDEP